MVYYNEDGSVTSNAAPRTLIGDNAIIAAKDAEIARLTAERDEARAQVAMAYEVAAETAADRCAACGCREISGLVKEHVRRLTPADAAAALAARDAAMRNEGRRQVKVKPLEWDALSDTTHRAPAPFFGSFRVEGVGRGKFIALWSVPGYCSTFIEGEFDSADQAKAAIAARILAALEPEGGE